MSAVRRHITGPYR